MSSSRRLCSAHKRLVAHNTTANLSSCFSLCLLHFSLALFPCKTHITGNVYRHSIKARRAMLKQMNQSINKQRGDSPAIRQLFPQFAMVVRALQPFLLHRAARHEKQPENQKAIVSKQVQGMCNKGDSQEQDRAASRAASHEPIDVTDWTGVQLRRRKYTEEVLRRTDISAPSQRSFSV